MTAAAPLLARTASMLGGAFEYIASPRLSILIFHRVLPTRDPLFPEEMHSQRFDELLRFLGAEFNVITLGEAAARLDESELPRRALCITFDDGYADNAEVALPLLLRHGLKATFFVATGFLDGGRMFNDSVIECLRRTGLDSVDLGEFGLPRRSTASAADRRGVIDALLPKVKYLGLAEREGFIARLHRLAGAPELPGGLMMRSEQVRQLHRAGMEIGAHTVRHPILRLLSNAEAQDEIAGGRARLQALVDAAVEVFAYPNGKPGEDYDHRHVDMVRRLGFRAAVSTSPGVVSADSDRHQLPRFTPWDQDLGRWASRLVHSRVAGGRPAVAQALA